MLVEMSTLNDNGSGDKCGFVTTAPYPSTFSYVLSMYCRLINKVAVTLLGIAA